MVRGGPRRAPRVQPHRVGDADRRMGGAAHPCGGWRRVLCAAKPDCQDFAAVQPTRRRADRQLAAACGAAPLLVLTVHTRLFTSSCFALALVLTTAIVPAQPRLGTIRGRVETPRAPQAPE